MITDAIIGLLTNLVNTLLGSLPTFAMPSWFAAAAGPIQTVMGVGASLGAWVPTGLVITVLTALLAANGVAFGIKIARIVASFATFGGGSAA